MPDHPLDQLDPRTHPTSDSACSVRISKRDKFRKFWGLSKSKTEEVKLKSPNLSQYSRASLPQSTQPPFVVSQASNLPSGEHQSSPSNALPSGDNQSTSPRTAQEKTLSANETRALEMIFAENVPKPTKKTELPQIRQRIEMTQQLIHCR
ncbi:hypothetical protein BKA57DRAFT_436803 [Linnemannia elongata]|nr:hypothetical protein BKA57DRAFT_436803 [Linnemannia elongata]